VCRVYTYMELESGRCRAGERDTYMTSACSCAAVDGDERPHHTSNKLNKYCTRARYVYRPRSWVSVFVERHEL